MIGKFSATNAFDTKLEKIDTSLIAVQGPKAASILQNGTSEDLSDIFFMQGKVFIHQSNSHFFSCVRFFCLKFMEKLIKEKH